MIASEVLRVRLVAYTDPLVLPMLAELSDEYSARYGEGHGFPTCSPSSGAARPSSAGPTVAWSCWWIPTGPSRAGRSATTR